MKDSKEIRGTKKWYVALAVLLCSFGIVNAQNKEDHLEPVGGIFDMYDFQFEYYSKVRKILFDGLTDRPEIRFQVMPSFTPEDVLDIEFDRGKDVYYMVYHIAEQMIWHNKQSENIEIERFRIVIDKESVKLIKSLFSNAIAQVRFRPLVVEGGKVTVGTDGINYYFTVNEHEAGIKSGKVWSPERGTKMDRLVAIGNKLIELAKSDARVVKFDDTLRKEINELITELE